MSMMEITAPTRAEFVERIKGYWHRTREGVLAIGRSLMEAKEALEHGEFTDMLEQDMPFSPRSARAYMQIASDPRIEKWQHAAVLPESGRALIEVTKLSDEAFTAAAAVGDLHPKVTAEQVRAIVRPPKHVVPREPQDLRLPIGNADELLSTMKGYRAIAGLPQLAVDDIAGTQEGYVSKLEVDIRRAINESWWSWMGALRLVMILVPAKDAIRTDRCPCCGAVKR